MRRLASPRAVAAVALAAGGIWLVAFFVTGHDVRDAAHIGTRSVTQAHSSTVIRFDPGYRYPPNHDSLPGRGYDGQFAYFLALDPVHAKDYMDDPPLRYGRILYPMVARGLALGRASAVPWTLLAINWLSIAAGTLFLAMWLRRRGAAPWLALAFGLFPGLLFGLERDLSEPLAYALVALAVLAADRGGIRAAVGAGLAFGLAGLARDTTLVFAVPYAVALAAAGSGPLVARVRRNAVPTACFAALAFLPAVLWTAFLVAKLGRLTSGAALTPVPFGGLVTSQPWQLIRQPVAILTVMAPGLAVSAVVLRSLPQMARRPETWALLANVILFVVLLGARVYRHGYATTGRYAAGVVLAGVLCAASLPGLTHRRRIVLAGSALLALAMWPAVAIYGLHDFRVS